MIFTEPIPFAEALQSREVKSVLKNELTSKELERIAPEIRERSKFSAGVANAEFVDEFDGIVTKILNPTRVKRADGTTATEGMDFATGALELKKFLDATGYKAPKGREGTIQDLSSFKRRSLILETNTQMAQGYGDFEQGNDPDVLILWPAKELYRAQKRNEPRNWPVRWLNACGEVGDEKAAAALRQHGMMAARKDSAVWTHLGPFELPYAPFDFGSGMDCRDVKAARAREIGLIQAGETVKPQDRGFNDLLQATPEVRSERLKQALVESLDDDFVFEGDVLKRRSPRGVRAARASIEEPGKQPLIEKPQIEQKVTKQAQPGVKPVSEALEVVRREDRSKVEGALKVIDQLHDDGVLPKISIDGVVKKEKSNGAYRYLEKEAFGIGVRPRRGDEFTTWHEVGHFLDHQGLGSAGVFASVEHEDLQEWREAVRKTESIQALKAIKPTLKGELLKYVKYLLKPQEVWARSYAQWVAKQAIERGLGDQFLTRDMKAALEHRLNSYMQGGHWQADDFQPVAHAIEKLFRKKGWIKE